MKKLYSIIFLMFLFLPLVFGADAVAIQSDGTYITLSPVWEREADARIWSDRVIKDFKSGSSEGFKINALCDETALKEIKEIKKLALEIIKEDVFSKTGTSPGNLALKIFRRAEEYIPAYDASEDSVIIARFKLLPQKDRPGKCSGFSGSSPPEAPDLLCAYSAGLTVNTGNPEFKKSNAGSGRVKPDYPVYKSRLKPGALRDREEADYYRIFFYIKDDDWIKKLSSNKIFFPLHYSLINKLYFFITRITKEQNRITGLNRSRIKSFKNYSSTGCPGFPNRAALIFICESERPQLCNYNDRPFSHSARFHVNNTTFSINSRGAVL